MKNSLLQVGQHKVRKSERYITALISLNQCNGYLPLKCGHDLLRTKLTNIHLVKEIMLSREAGSTSLRLKLPSTGREAILQMTVCLPVTLSQLSVHENCLLASNKYQTIVFLKFQEAKSVINKREKMFLNICINNFIKKHTLKKTIICHLLFCMKLLESLSTHTFINTIKEVKVCSYLQTKNSFKY